MPNKRYDWCGKYPKWINLKAITCPIRAENIKFWEDSLKEINSKNVANIVTKKIIINNMKYDPL